MSSTVQSISFPFQSFLEVAAVDLLSCRTLQVNKRAVGCVRHRLSPTATLRLLIDFCASGPLMLRMKCRAAVIQSMAPPAPPPLVSLLMERVIVIHHQSVITAAQCLRLHRCTLTFKHRFSSSPAAGFASPRQPLESFFLFSRTCQMVLDSRCHQNCLIV